MSDSTLWWLLVGAFVGLELFTGTFYLLMLSLGLVAAALAAHAGANTVVQLVSAALLGSVAVVALYWYRKRQPLDPSVRSLRSVNLDVGEVIQVHEWLPDGTARVQYRGAQWTVIQRPGNETTAGAYRVTELVGNRLVVEKA
jgi:membrane protein implicated in regulation of membrane protease activity